MPSKQTNAKLGTPAARGTPQPEDDEPGDAEVSLEQLAAVLHNIQNQLGGYGARLAAIERAGAEANAETDAAAGVGQGGVPPAPAPQCARAGCSRPAHPDDQGGFYRHCGRTCYVQDSNDVDDTRSAAGSDTSSRLRLLGDMPPRHVALIDAETSYRFLWTDRNLESLSRNLDEAARQELVDVLVARQLAVDMAAAAHATIRNTSGTARFYALLQRLTAMLDIITDAWHVAPLRLNITNRTDMLASRLLLDEQDNTTDMLCTDKMRSLVLDRLQKNAEHTTRKLSGRGNDKDDGDGNGRRTTRGRRGGGSTRTRAPAPRADPPRTRRSPSPERERGRERSRARQSSTAGDNGGARRGAGGDNNGARRGAAAHGGGQRASSQ